MPEFLFFAPSRSPNFSKWVSRGDRMTALINRVTKENLTEYIELYAKARGGEANEETESEAMFVVLAKYRGIYILSTGFLGPVWIGLQNATARWTHYGKPFPSVRAALEGVLNDAHPLSTELAVYYSDNSVTRLRFLANQIEAYKRDGDFLLWAQA